MLTNKLYGLVLSGGKSQRMGKDKGQISYHGQPQSIYLYRLLDQFCDETFLSIRAEQEVEYDQDISVIQDLDEYRGPFNGLLSAHRKFPEAAFLVVACDLPLMDAGALELLINEREPGKAATAFATKKTGLPEPLAAIWESEGLKQAASYLANSESSCPRKYLLNSDINLVQAESDTVLLNANSEEEYREVMKIISA